MSSEDLKKPPVDDAEESSNFWNYVFVAFLCVLVYYMGVRAAIALLAIIFIIATVHEFDNYLASRLVGVRVDEFSVGFGSPKLWGRRIGETDYSLRPIPLGAYVKPAGMDSEEVYEPGNDPGERSFSRKGLLAKLLILFAGPVANILLTMVIMSGLFWVVGDRPTTIEVDKILRDEPAALAGIRPGDVLLAVNGLVIKDYIEGIDIIGRNPGRPIAIKIRRAYDGGGPDPVYREFDITATPKANEDGVGKLGMTVKPFVIEKSFTPLPFDRACRKGFEQTLGYVAKMYEMTLLMFHRAFRKMEVPEQIGGPFKIAQTIKEAVGEELALADLLSLIAWLSMSIGVFNLLPIPALDGGRILVLLVGWVLWLGHVVLRRPVPREGVISPRFEEAIHVFGFIALILLLVVVSWKDLKDIFAPQTFYERNNIREDQLIGGQDATGATTAPSAVPAPGK